ncbi:MAG TPA: hypothetical protein VJG83_00510 [archaeon]|nr:hypothetical protein [archaeon]
MRQILRMINSCTAFGLLWCAIITIISLWAGLVALFSPLIFALSFFIAFFLHKKFPFEFHVNGFGWAFCGLVLVLVLTPVLLSGGVAASADAVTTTAIRVLTEKIPPTYAPYSDVSFTYQLGFPLLVQTFSDIFPLLPDFQWAWIFGAVFAALLVPLVFEFCREWISPDAAVLGAALVVSSKLVFQNFYWGEFAWVASTVYLLAAFLYLKKNHPFAIFFISAVAAMHPAVFFNLLIVLAIFYLYKKELHKIQWLLVAILLILPALYFNYLPIATNLISGYGDGAGPDIGRLAAVIPIAPLWIGAGLTLSLLLSFLVLFAEKKPLLGKWAALLGVSTLIFLILYTTGTVLANREIELVLLSAILCAAANWSRTSLFTKYKMPVLAAFLVIGLLSFYSSSTLTHLREGSKISPQEIEFAYKFRVLDPDAKKTIFFNFGGGGKMVEIANKAPYDANSDYLISTAQVLIIRNAAWDEFIARHKHQESIRKTACAECILELKDLEYAVIDYNYAPIELPREVLLEVGSIKLYKLNDS